VRRWRVIVLAAVAAAAAVPAGAAAAPHYTGPRYGVPFDVRLSGTLTRAWTITEKPFSCEPAGGGSQTVRFRTPGVAHARFASLQDHAPGDRFAQVVMALPLAFTVAREDDTALVPPPDGESCDPVPPHACGERTLSMKGFRLVAQRHRLRLELTPDVPGTLDDAVDELWSPGTNCLFPTAEGVIAQKVRWPGNPQAFRPGRRLRFTVTQQLTHRAWVDSTDDPNADLHTSEQVQGTFTVRLHNRCRPVPKRLRKYVGFSCDAENGVIPVR
jgi:hypothetical protein